MFSMEQGNERTVSSRRAMGTSARRASRRRPVVGGERQLEATTPAVPRLRRRTTAGPKGPRLRLPRIAIRWQPERPRVAAFVLLALVMGGLYELGNHDLFYVPAVDVQGNSNVPQAEIERAAGVTYWNIFFVDPGAIQATVWRAKRLSGETTIGVDFAAWSSPKAGMTISKAPLPTVIVARAAASPGVMT